MGWKKPIPPSSGHPHLGLTLLGQVLNRAYYFATPEMLRSKVQQSQL